MTISQDQIAAYGRDGQVVVEDVVSGAEVEALRTRTEQIATGEVNYPRESLEYEPTAKGDERSLESLRKINQPSLDPVLATHTRHAGILNIVGKLIGPDVKLFGDQFFIKPPGGIEKTYHQDSPYFKIEPMALVTAWTALDDVTLENGCMYVVPGSQNGGPLEHSEPWMVGGRQDMKIPDSEINFSKERPVTMGAGDVSFHHSLILHRSGPNNTPQFRRGLAVHYMAARSRWTGDLADKPDYALLRGVEHPNCV